jgi:D-sedoheptulose 7-phosphate isomerase
MAGMIDAVLGALDEHQLVIDRLRAGGAHAIVEASEMCIRCLRSGGTLLLCGNGGSAADAQHLAAEFTGRYLRRRDAWPAIALSTNTSAVTAIGNDYGFEEVFARQVAAYGRPGDVLVAISTSGASPNVVRAAEVARERGLKVIAMTGGSGGKMRDLADIHLNVPSNSTPRIQESHILVGHVLCALVEDALCEKP